MNKSTLIRSLRYALTIFLLFIVWNNAHWSVALSITLINVSIEATAVSLGLIAKAIQALSQGNKRDLERMRAILPKDIADTIKQFDHE